jgi:hypothetical protein
MALSFTFDSQPDGSVLLTLTGGFMSAADADPMQGYRAQAVIGQGNAARPDLPTGTFTYDLPAVPRRDYFGYENPKFLLAGDLLAQFKRNFAAGQSTLNSIAVTHRTRPDQTLSIDGASIDSYLS